MQRREYTRLENKFQRHILDFWMEHDEITPDWIMRVLIETAVGYTPKVNEYYEDRADYDKSFAFDMISEEWDLKQKKSARYKAIGEIIKREKEKYDD